MALLEVGEVVRRPGRGAAGVYIHGGSWVCGTRQGVVVCEDDRERLFHGGICSDSHLSILKLDLLLLESSRSMRSPGACVSPLDVLSSRTDSKWAEHEGLESPRRGERDLDVQAFLWE